MRLKKIIALMLVLVMVISVMPVVSIRTSAAGTTDIIDALGAKVLFSCPDGSFNDTPVGTAFEGWSSTITSGYVNVKSYSVGNVLQYYSNGTENKTVVNTPGYGYNAEKIIIEWVMKRNTTNDLYFDFSFRDYDGKEIAFLKLDKNAVEPGASHPQNDELYAMGFPDEGEKCAIVAYNNADGATHTAEYYVGGECVTTLDSLEGTFTGFMSIVSSNGRWSTAWKHIGFANLTIGAVLPDTYKTVTVQYKAGDEIVKTSSGVYDTVSATGCEFGQVYYSANGSSDMYYAPANVYGEDTVGDMTVTENAGDYSVGDTITFENTVYEVKSKNLVPNGYFSRDMGCEGWYNSAGEKADFFTSLGGEMSVTKGGGDRYSTNSLYRVWPIEKGKKYYFSYAALDESEWNIVSGKDTMDDVEDGVVIMGGNTSYVNQVVFDSEYNYLQINFRWLEDGTAFAAFQLYEVEEADVSYTTTVYLRDSYTDGVLDTIYIDKYKGETITFSDYVPETATYNNNAYTKNEDNPASLTVEGSAEVDIYYTTEGYVTLEYDYQSSYPYTVEPNMPLFPETVTAIRGTGERETVSIVSWDKELEYDNGTYYIYAAYGGIEDSNLKRYMNYCAYPNSFSLEDMESVSGQTVADDNLTMFPEALRDNFIIEMEVQFEQFGDMWIVLKDSENKLFFGPDQVLVGVDSNGQVNLVNGDGEGGKATSNVTLATLELNTPYRIMITADALDDLYTISVYDNDGIIAASDAMGFRTDSEIIDCVTVFTNNGVGSAAVSNVEVYSSAMVGGKSIYAVNMYMDGELVSSVVGEYYNHHYITAEEIEGYTLTKTVDGNTVTFIYDKEGTDSSIAVLYVNEAGETVWSVDRDSVSVGDVISAREMFAVTDSTTGFYQIPETTITAEYVSVTVYKTEGKYAVIEDAYVQYSTLYGIDCTNANGVMIASSADENRGPQYDANGETTYLNGSNPTTLGSTRVGLMEFPVMDINDNERATMKLYARNWHSQGFDGSNTFLRIAATPLNSSSWTDKSEGAWIDVALETLLEDWQTPVFSEKATYNAGYVSFDVTEIMHAAKAKGLETISFKFQIYWGAAYVAEKEASVLGGSYENRAAYIEVTEDENLIKKDCTGTNILTKNGSFVNGDTVYLTESDDVRFVADGAIAIGTDEGLYDANVNIGFKGYEVLTNATPLGFGLKMVDGAQVRVGGGLDKTGRVSRESGLRFITKVDRVDTLAGRENAILGVEITTEDANFEPARIVAEKWQSDTMFTSAVINLDPSNYNRNLTATPFVEVDSKVFRGNPVTRSIYKVAAGLLVNGNFSGDAGYTDEGLQSQMLFDVLNAYVNQVGIRLSLVDNADFTDKELVARTTGNGSYTGDLFFEVGETSVDGRIYSVTLTPIGEKTKINTTDGFWDEYVRINNNNSSVKVYTTLTDNGDGTCTLSFDTSNLNIGLTDEERLERMKPTYAKAVAAMESANTFWQNYQSYSEWYSSTHPAFWDKAAYHTGNMEMYKLTGDESYLQYTIDWANYCEWSGNNSTSDPSTWTWGYNQNQGSNAVLFGDWQICFQTYIDLYNLNESGVLEIEGASVDRALEVMGYQITKDEDAFWWWADALYMVMPVMTKLYKLTGDEAYLDALYKYFKYAKELMYDGEGGIPTSSDGYTTSAALTSGASYSDPDDYKNLFFRDAGYVYPLMPNTGHEDEKNFWARGNGWVFAGLSKVLADMPEDYEHYDEFKTTYLEMAEAIVACQAKDKSGYGFWTQSMLQGYPVSSENPYGYETSGTAFFTYGLFWGINNGLLTDEIYEEAAIRGWGYLNNVALQENGMVGYGQYIGSNATSAMTASNTQNYTVGAFLLACCEAARWANSN